MKSLFASASALVLGSLLSVGSLLVQPAHAQTDTITDEEAITGLMEIDFATRSKLDTSGDLRDGSAALGVKDKYKFNLNVDKTTNFTGEITRQPNLFSKVLQRKKQEAALGFSVDLAVMNPKDLKQKRVVGKWVGTVPIDPASGNFDMAGGAAKDSALRVQIDTVGKAQGFEEKFGGVLVGKAEKKEGLASYTYKRVVGDKELSFVVKRSDPMRFDNVILAKGPAEVYPRTSVSGRLDYDYETGNWLTDGIKFRYTMDGKEVEDIVTGTIKWIEDADRASNGKGYYEFNLRFNEAKNKTASSEAAAFDKMSAEDAFFAVDNTIPCLTGRVSYVDTFRGGSTTPISSKIEYKLGANKLSKQQVMNFFKLWLVGVGPINDE
ncbi:MAG: hypothetical protein NTV94_03665 [Planctomycetota bacterium]|nr:hypothetical protein [Planctomycetota bacterium]